LSKILSQHKKSFFILGLVIFFYAVNNFIWLRLNNYPSGPDEFWHLLRGLKFSKALLSNPQEFLYLSVENASHWPPLFHMSSAIVAFFAGASYLSLVMTNIIYLAILLFSVYFIGLKLFDQNTGLLAAIITSAYPMVFISSRFFNPDFALLAMTCLSICFLIYSDYFRDRKFSVLFGISFGLGMLAKISLSYS
jgi:asparagine N-glycosylation enzyme membrane subunit Stt3